MANNTIFKFADKFGYESPFGNWLEDKKQDAEKPTIVSINAYLNINLIKFNGGKIFSKKIDIYDYKKQKSVKKMWKLDIMRITHLIELFLFF